MNPPTLFDMDRPGDYRSTDPMPSRKGAAANLVARKTQKKQMLKRLLVAPATAADLADITGNQNSRASKRLGELRDDGLVYGYGYEYPPAGRGGVPRTVYALTDHGRRDAELMTRGGS